MSPYHPDCSAWESAVAVDFLHNLVPAPFSQKFFQLIFFQSSTFAIVHPFLSQENSGSGESKGFLWFVWYLKVSFRPLYAVQWYRCHTGGNLLRWFTIESNKSSWCSPLILGLELPVNAGLLLGFAFLSSSQRVCGRHGGAGWNGMFISLDQGAILILETGLWYYFRG